MNYAIISPRIFRKPASWIKVKVTSVIDFFSYLVDFNLLLLRAMSVSDSVCLTSQFLQTMLHFLIKFKSRLIPQQIYDIYERTVSSQKSNGGPTDNSSTSVVAVDLFCKVDFYHYVKLMFFSIHKHIFNNIFIILVRSLHHPHYIRILGMAVLFFY